MRSKSILLLLIALGCGIVASVAVSQVVLDQKSKGDVQTIGILVVAKDLSASTKIPADGFRVEQWPLDRVPAGAITDPKSVENKFTKQRLYAGEPIIEAKLSAKGKEFSVPVGYRIFDITVRDESGGGGYIGPGDRVDVFGYFEKGARIHAAKSVKVMENLEVVMIDGVAVVDPEATTQKKSSTIQLLVKDSQYVVLDTAANLGRLRLALRPPEPVGSVSNHMDDGENFMTWLNKEYEGIQAEKSEKEVKPVAETKSLVSVKPQKEVTHEMVIISPTKTTKYREIDGQMVTVSAEAEAEAAAAASRANQQPYYAYPPSYKSPSNFGGQGAVPGASGWQQQSGLGLPSNSSQNSPISQPGSSTKSGESSGASQTNMSWDASSGSWQSGGFKPTYPTGK